MVPFVAVQLPVVEAPVSDPVRRSVPLEQTDAEVGEAVTPLNELTFIALEPLLGEVMLIKLQGLIACTVIACTPVEDEELTDTVTEFVEPPEITDQPVGRSQL